MCILGLIILNEFVLIMENFGIPALVEEDEAENDYIPDTDNEEENKDTSNDEANNKEKENDLISSEQIYTYTSTLVAGEKGCTIIAIPKDRLASFLDDNPGVLLSLLGTQITV